MKSVCTRALVRNSDHKERKSCRTMYIHNQGCVISNDKTSDYLLFTGRSKLTWNLSRWPEPIRTRHRRGTKTKLKILQKTSHSQIKSQNHGKFAAFSQDFIIFCIYDAHSTFSKSISAIHLHRKMNIFYQNLNVSNIM